MINRPLITTIKERCRVCYTCVRECPARAIRIADRQAEIIQERCLGCGNCVRVCSQHAKQAVVDIDQVWELIDGPHRVAAAVAPSFPADYLNLKYEVIVGMIRSLGFDLVNEVAVGADLVAAEYARLLARTEDARYIATSCPAITGYVERYQPDLVPQLAPIVSPMVATARALRLIYGDDLRIVFIGPCIAKKGEINEDSVSGEIDVAITFQELRQMLKEKDIGPWTTEPSDFDRPHAGIGALFPISGGMLQAGGIEEDLIEGEVIAARGRVEFVEAIREFASGDLDCRLLELLACEGCIMGPGMSSDAPLFRRRARVSSYVRRRLGLIDQQQQREDRALLKRVNLHRTFTADDQRLRPPDRRDVQQIMHRMGKFKPEDELNCGACGYATCREHAIAVSEGLAESEMCLPYMIEQLGKTCTELTTTNEQLASTQHALVQAEKLASMGQLAAGIAHEVNNPLSTVLMLSHVLLDEAKDGTNEHQDLCLIASEADRCKTIVSGLLQFARKNKVEASVADMCDLVQRTVRAMPPHDGIDVNIDCPDGGVEAEVDSDQVLQVLANLATNAIAAMPDGGMLSFKAACDDSDVHLSVADTGCGIPDEHRRKIFEPFFTTKQAGKGTGLGLAISYGIVKMHHGDISVESNTDPQEGPTGTTFGIRLPKKRRAKPDEVAA